MSETNHGKSINKPLLNANSIADPKKSRGGLVSRSGKQFASVDHYIAENILQNFYPKDNKEDLQLLENTEENDVTPIVIDEEISPGKKGWIARTCGPMNPGSLRGSIFALMSTALGAGAFALPNALFYKCGFIIGIIFLIGTAILTLSSLNILMKCSNKANALNYPDLAEHCFGRWAGKTIQWALIIYVFGVICGYQIIVSNFLIQLIRDDFGWKSSDWKCDNYDCGIRDIMIVAVTFIVLPLSLKRNFYAFRHVTIIGVCSILYAIFVVFGEVFKKQDKADSDIKMGLAHFDLNLFTGYTSALFSFTCYTVVFPIRMELNNPIEKRITKIFNRSVMVEFVLYFILSLSGYFTIYQLDGGKVKDLIIQQSSSVPMIISRVFMVLFLFIAIPININPGRAQVINVIKGPTQEYDKKLHIIVTLVFLFGPCAVGIVFPKIQSVFSFLGGACSTLFGITFPYLMYVKLSPEKWSSPFNLLLIVLAILLTIIGYIAAIISMCTAFDAFKI